MKNRSWKIRATPNLLALAMFGLTQPGDAQVNYAVDTNTATAYVTNSPSASGDIAIASTYDGYPVSSIGQGAFSLCTSLTNVTIPNSVTNISDYAFRWCYHLVNVTISNGVQSISQGAFYLCYSLTNVTIPNSVISIGFEAFRNCNDLTNVTIPNSVTDIEANAFYGSGLTSVVIPNSITSIGSGVFEDCSGLTNVTIPNSVTNIGANAFDGSALTSVTIPSSITSIGNAAFYYCLSLTNISVDSANPSYASAGGVLFNKAATVLIECPGGLKGSFTIPNSVASISASAFEYCTALGNVIIPDSVTNIGQLAFDSCYGLRTVTIGNGINNTGFGVFQHCTSLGGVIIPSSFTSISQQAFNGCSSLTNVMIGNGVTNIGDIAFQNCTSLGSVTIPDGVTSIGSGLFEGCSSLSNVVIGSGITNFISGSLIFYGCGNLNSVTFLGNAPTADSSIFDFDNVSKIMVYYEPGTTGWDTFASTVGVTVAPAFGSTTYTGQPVIFYPRTGPTKTLQMSTNPASGNWVTVSNAVMLAALEVTNPPVTGFFRLESSAGSPPAPGLAVYFNLPVLFYPTNSAYSLFMTTNLPASSWRAPSGRAFASVEITNAPPGAVFRLY